MSIRICSLGACLVAKIVLTLMFPHLKKNVTIPEIAGIYFDAEAHGLKRCPQGGRAFRRRGGF